jgi:hypothetical protein
MTLKLTIYEQHTSTHTKETGKYLNRGWAWILKNINDMPLLWQHAFVERAVIRLTKREKEESGFTVRIEELSITAWLMECNWHWDAERVMGSLF